MYPKAQSWDHFCLTHICDSYFDIRDLENASSADFNAAPYTCLPDMFPILKKLEKSIKSMFVWFSKSFLKANAEKCHLIASSKILVGTQISTIKATSESRVKLFGIYKDNRLNFDYHISLLYQKASKNLHALARIFKYLETSKHRDLV